MWNGRSGWSVGWLLAWLAWLAGSLTALLASWGYGSRVSPVRCVPALACVTYKQETACWGDTLLASASRTANTLTHTYRKHARASNLRVSEREREREREFSTSVAFSGETFWRICGPDFVGLFSCRANGGIFITMARLLSLWCIALPARCTHVYAECRFRVRANIWHEVLGLREVRGVPRNW